MSEQGSTATEQETAVTVERRGHVLLMGLNRPQKRNAFNLTMIDQLAAAYYELEEDEDLRCGVLFAHGDHFTGGLDLAEVGPVIQAGELKMTSEDRRDPWRKDAIWTTPIVAAVQGWVMTLAIELLLAADIRIAAENSRFSQMEINRGIYAFGGATIRLPRDAGWGNAMLAADRRGLRRRRGIPDRASAGGRRDRQRARPRDRARRGDRHPFRAAGRQEDTRIRLSLIHI